MTLASWALKKRAPSSASAADASTFLIRVERMCIAPFNGGGVVAGEWEECGVVGSDERKK